MPTRTISLIEDRGMTAESVRKYPWASWAGGYGWTVHRTQQAAINRIKRLQRETIRMSGGPACHAFACPTAEARIRLG